MDEPLREPRKYEKLTWYPHLSPVEAAIWDRFIDSHPTEYGFVEYDVKIGPIPDFVADHEDAAMQKQAPLYQYKIDVIGHNTGVLDIIELKQRADFKTIGQVEGYCDLYIKEFSPTTKPRCVIIAEIVAPALVAHAASKGIQLYLV